MVWVASHKISRVSWYSGTRFWPLLVSFTQLSCSMADYSKSFNYHRWSDNQPYNPTEQALWFRLFPFRSPLLRESHSFSFPLPT